MIRTFVRGLGVLVVVFFLMEVLASIHPRLLAVAILIGLFILTYLKGRADGEPSPPIHVYSCCWATVGEPHFLSCDSVSPEEAAERIEKSRRDEL